MSSLNKRFKEVLQNHINGFYKSNPTRGWLYIFEDDIRQEISRILQDDKHLTEYFYDRYKNYNYHMGLSDVLEEVSLVEEIGLTPDQVRFVINNRNSISLNTVLYWLARNHKAIKRFERALEHLLPIKIANR